MINEQDEIYIDLSRVWDTFLKSKKVCICITIICMLLSLLSGYLMTTLSIGAEYESSGRIMVSWEPSIEMLEQNTNNVSQMSSRIVNNSVELIKSEVVLAEVSNTINNEYDIRELQEMLAVTPAVSEVIEISIATDNPELSANIINEIINVFNDKVHNIINDVDIITIDEAFVPEVENNIVKYGFIGIAIGVVISGVYVVVKALRDTKIKTEEEVKSIFDYPIIGRISNCKSNNNIKDLNDIVSEEYRKLRTNILSLQSNKDMKVINVISNLANEGNSTIVFNLGKVFALAGKKTLIVDADIRTPTIHKMLKIENKLGLTDILTEKVSLSDSLISYSNNLDVITSGLVESNPADLLQSSNLKELVEELKKMYEVILIDSSAIENVTDGVIMSECCDGTLLVIACDKDDRKDLINVNEQLKQTNTNVIGIVMTKMPLSNKL